MQNLSKDINKAREQALIVNYDNAEVYFGSAVTSLQRLAKQGDMREELKETTEMLVQEFELVKMLKLILASFEEDPVKCKEVSDRPQDSR